MVDYEFYKTGYMGEIIPESEYPRLIRRAEDQFARYRRIYSVSTKQGVTEQDRALCAMAEVLFNAETVANGEGAAQSVSVGSVSASYGNTAAQAVDVTPAGVERALFQAARLYVDIYTGVS